MEWNLKWWQYNLFMVFILNCEAKYVSRLIFILTKKCLLLVHFKLLRNLERYNFITYSIMEGFVRQYVCLRLYWSEYSGQFFGMHKQCWVLKPSPPLSLRFRSWGSEHLKKKVLLHLCTLYHLLFGICSFVLYLSWAGQLTKEKKKQGEKPKSMWNMSSAAVFTKVWFYLSHCLASCPGL